MTTRIVAINLAKKDAWSHDAKIVAFCHVETPTARFRRAALVRLRHDAGWTIHPRLVREGHALTPVVGVCWVTDAIPAAAVDQAVELYLRLGGEDGVGAGQ
jgi:hypothetical protein